MAGSRRNIAQCLRRAPGQPRGRFALGWGRAAALCIARTPSGCSRAGVSQRGAALWVRGGDSGERGVPAGEPSGRCRGVVVNHLLAKRGWAACAGFPEPFRGHPVPVGCWGPVEGGWGLALGWVHPCSKALAELGGSQPRSLPSPHGFAERCLAPPAPDGHQCLKPQLSFSNQVDRSQLFPAVSLGPLPPRRKKSPPFQAAICLFCWTRNLLKCLSMDEEMQSRRTEPGRLHGEWKIVFWDFLEFEGPMMDVHVRDGNGFVSIKTQSKRITLPNRLRNVSRTGSAPLRHGRERRC